jgi:hypothetical protein
MKQSSFDFVLHQSQRNGTKSESMDRLKTSTHKFSCIENKGTSFLTHAGSTWNRWDGNWRGGIFTGQIAYSRRSSLNFTGNEYT